MHKSHASSDCCAVCWRSQPPPRLLLLLLLPSSPAPPYPLYWSIKKIDYFSQLPPIWVMSLLYATRSHVSYMRVMSLLYATRSHVSYMRVMSLLYVSWLLYMSHVSYTWNQPSTVYMSHVSPVWVMSLIYGSCLSCMSHDSYIWVMSLILEISHLPSIWVMSLQYESCLLYMGHVSPVWVMTLISESRLLNNKSAIYRLLYTRCVLSALFIDQKSDYFSQVMNLFDKKGGPWFNSFCFFIFFFIDICILTSKHTYIHTYTHKSIHTYTHKHTVTHTHTHTHAHMHTYTHTHIQTYMHAHTHTTYMPYTHTRGLQIEVPLFVDWPWRDNENMFPPAMTHAHIPDWRAVVASYESCFSCMSHDSYTRVMSPMHSRRARVRGAKSPAKPSNMTRPSSHGPQPLRYATT
jgi:hypothetical protein